MRREFFRGREHAAFGYQAVARHNRLGMAQRYVVRYFDPPVGQVGDRVADGDERKEARAVRRLGKRVVDSRVGEADEEGSLAVLRDAVVRRVEDGELHRVADRGEPLQNVVPVATLVFGRYRADVLDQDCLRAKALDDPGERVDELVARVGRKAVAQGGETLAGRPAHHDIGAAPAGCLR